jgi:MFS family permease
VAWSALADAVPLYPLYALLFADTGLSEAEISALFALWSIVAVVAEVPSGAWADRYSRRSALVIAGVLQAAGYLLWIGAPGCAGFAGGFVLWGVGGALASGSFQALVYDGLAEAGASERYAAVLGRAEAAGLAVQVPIAGAAVLLFALGGYALAGWVSVGVCLAAAAVAVTLPDAGSSGSKEARPRYIATLRAGLAEAAGSPPVRSAVLAVAVLSGFAGLEEYFPLLAGEWGVRVGAVPLAVLAVPLVGAVGAALGGRAMRLGPPGVLLGMLAAAAALAAAGLARHPVGLVGLTLFYGLYRLMLVVADARLQECIGGSARATVTSVAGVGSELAAAALFGVLAVGGLTLVTVLAVISAAALPWWLRRDRPAIPQVSASSVGTS